MNEFKVNGALGSSFNAIVLNAAGQIWNTNSGQFQALTLPSWPQFLIPLYPQGIPTLFYGDFPMAIVSAGVYTVQVYNAADMPPEALPKFSGDIGWDGTKEVSPDTLGTVSGGAGGETWSDGEKAQIRQASGSTARKCPRPEVTCRARCVERSLLLWPSSRSQTRRTWRSCSRC